MSTTQDFNWITKRYSELQKKYPGQYIAVKNGKVVASGRDLGKVYDAAVRRVKKDFVTGYIVSGDPFIFNTQGTTLPESPRISPSTGQGRGSFICLQHNNL